MCVCVCVSPVALSLCHWRLVSSCICLCESLFVYLSLIGILLVFLSVALISCLSLSVRMCVYISVCSSLFFFFSVCLSLSLMLTCLLPLVLLSPFYCNGYLYLCLPLCLLSGRLFVFVSLSVSMSVCIFLRLRNKPRVTSVAFSQLTHASPSTSATLESSIDTTQRS